MKKKPSFHEMRKLRNKFPDKGNSTHLSKKLKVERKQLESIPLERTEARKLGLNDLNKSADRMNYEHPVDRQAKKEISHK
jgi:hypothetical protein